ncbi:MAG: fumarylacetoacetate hydrolase family protein [Brevundimonas sp.]
MRLATLYTGKPDGQLAVVSDDGSRMLTSPDWPTLQDALEDWSGAEPQLKALLARLSAGEGEALAPEQILAPLPRAWQWLDGSAFRSHGELMERLFGSEPKPPERPLMYQGMSHVFIGPNADVALPRVEDGIDFEGEFGVITDFVPMGVSADEAMKHIRLVVQINDWSLRNLAGAEMKTGFGWVQAKPACSAAPFAVTPDTLGEAWRDGRVHLPLVVDWNGKRFGAPLGGLMAFGFHDLIAHAASTRDLCAGTLIGSGTVSNPDYRDVGSTCIAEQRAIEMLDEGAVRTGYLEFGDTVRMEARLPDGGVLFGAIEQQVVRAL